ncbi:putative protein FAM90A12P [Suncus etruscus]|uniref:putative protein FAM90A12P n=1 Tax=Suncus etruscus TaxID=109475 RepID=UPI0021109146|nr:putative protein FAM90A12P [Suncus etruscus]
MAGCLLGPSSRFLPLPGKGGLTGIPVDEAKQRFRRQCPCRFPEMGPVSGSSAQLWGPRARKAPRLKQRPQGAQVLPACSPVLEDPRVKCKDCGAFGHRTRSARCPLKGGQGAVLFVPLGSRPGKENVNPRGLPQRPHLDSAPREAEFPETRGPRPVPGRQSLLQRSPRREQGKPRASQKDSTETVAPPRATAGRWQRAARLPSLPSSFMPLMVPWGTESGCGGAPTPKQQKPCRPLPVHGSKGPGPARDGTRWPPARQPEPRPKAEPGPAWPPSILPPARRLARDTALILQSRLSGLHAGALGRAQAAAAASALAPSTKPRAHILFSGVSRVPGATAAPEPGIPTSSRSAVAGAKRKAHVLRDTSHSPAKKLRPSPCKEPPNGSWGTGACGAQTLHAAAQGSLGLAQAPGQGGSQAHTPGPARVPQPASSMPSSKGEQPLSGSCPPPSLTMVFRRLQGDCWCCGFLAENSGPPAGAAMAPAHRPPAPEPAPAPATHTPVSVLYEDLLVSSSEDSDQD